MLSRVVSILVFLTLLPIAVAAQPATRDMWRHPASGGSGRSRRSIEIWTRSLRGRSEACGAQECRIQPPRNAGDQRVGNFPERALQNLYELQPTNNPDLEKEVEESLNRKTTEDDTHPSPSDRFRFTRRIVSSSEQPVTGQVWDLFKDKEALTLEMTKVVQYELQGS